MKTKLSIELASQFAMPNKLTGKKETRYLYHVKGAKGAMDLFRKDALEGKCGKIDPKTGKLCFFSWTPPMNGAINTIERNDPKQTWHIDNSNLKSLEHFAQTAPTALKAIGTELLDRFFPAALVINEEEEEIEAIAEEIKDEVIVEEEDEDDGCPF